MKDVILVQRRIPRCSESENKRKLAELRELARAGNYNVVREVTQTRYPDRQYQIGKGKAQEVAELALSQKPAKIIFYNPLSVTQVYNLSEMCKCEVIDKFQLILEIFATRATTRRSRMQVELARLEYELPRARKIVSLLKMEERPGFMGMGGYEDSYEQDIKKRISRIKKELSTGQRDSENLRDYRHSEGFSLVCLAGYTNAGKSTLFRTLVDENVEVENMLFTTLSPTTRYLNINGRWTLLTDTVGFIEDLPHFLVDAFRSTLEDVFRADIILLVVDISEPVDVIRKKLAVSHEIFWEQLEKATIITAINKADRLSSEELSSRLKSIAYLAPNPVVVSAKTGEGLDELKDIIYSHLPEWKQFTLELPMSGESMSAVSWLFEEGIVHSVSYGNNIVMDVEARNEVYRKARSLEKRLSSGNTVDPASKDL